jgi:general stress protein YciG
MKRVLLGIVWFVVFYLGSCAAIGFVAGGIAGATDPAHAAEAGREAGQHIVKPLVPYLFGGSVLLAILGTVYGVLPGTKKKAS